MSEEDNSTAGPTNLGRSNARILRLNRPPLLSISPTLTSPSSAPARISITTTTTIPTENPYKSYIANSGDDVNGQETTTVTMQPSPSENDSEYMKLEPGDFTIIKKLGEGAAGTVWEVIHKQSDRTMAKKSITTDPDPSIRKQILRELDALRTCVSPNIVSFYGAFLEDEDTTISICMEYCEGGSLEAIYKRTAERGGQVTEGVLSRIAESVCEGLVFLHSKHVIHRDIKPSNILMTRKGEIKLCDFGVSGKLVESLAETFTGTRYYMAPERIQGRPYTVKSDIWSLGLTLYEVAESRPALPPPGKPLAIFELLDYIVHQPMPELKSLRSEELIDFIAACLLKSPEMRPGPAIMLQHLFVTTWKDREVDTAGWLTEIWEWM